MSDVSERGKDIGDDKGVHKEPFGKLKGDPLGARGTDAPHAFMDFEIVVGRKKGNGGVEGGVVEDRVRDLVLDETLRGWFRVVGVSLKR